MPFQENGLPKKSMEDLSREDLIQEVLQLKQTLALAKERTELILQATSDAVYEWDLQSGYLSWNEGFLNLIGCEQQAIEHTIHFWSAHLHPQDYERVQESLQAIFQQRGKLWVEQYRFRRKDGSYAYVLERGYIVYDDQNKPVRMVGTLQDVSKQKESELAREALSKEYSFLLDEIPSLVFSTQPDGQADFVNKQWLQYTGLAIEQIMGEGWTKAVHPLDRESTLQTWHKAVQLGIKYQIQHRLLRHDGVYRWFQMNAVPYKDKEGTIIKWFGTCTDIEEVRQAKSETEGQLNYFYSLLMAIPSPIAIVRGPEHLLEFFNPHLEKLLGNILQVGTSLAKCLESLPAGYLLEIIQEVFQNGDTSVITEVPVQLSGQQAPPDTYYNLHIQAIRNKTGTSNGVLIFGHDVSEQVNARKKIEQSRTRIRSILDGIPAMAWTTDIQGNTTYYNSHWYSYCGISVGEQVNSYELIHPEDRPAVASSWQEAQSSQTVWQAQYRLQRGDGTYHWHLGRTVPVLDSEGNLLEWFGVGTDIEEQKQTQKILENTLAELHEKNFELDQFVYKTSHDLRAPLTTILGLVTIIRGEAEESTKMQYVDLIEGRVQKLDTFIKSMLDYSRNTRTPVQAASIYFPALVEECIQELANLKHFDRLQISTQISGETFHSDPFRLKVIFSNLISNAVKYQDFSKADSYLHIHITVSASQAEIELKDNGVGIEQAYQDRIFSMFFRATEQSEGSGLGLYIVKQAVTVLQGSIMLESTINKGTCFKIHLPTMVVG
jgi:PAS domain S-box-containing protein